MTRPYEYFATSCGRPGVDATLGKLGMSTTDVTIETRVHFDHDAGGTRVSYFIPATDSVLPVARDLLRPRLIRSLIRNAGVFETDPVAREGERRTSATGLPFTGRVAIYSDCDINDADWSRLMKVAASSRVNLTFHGPEYARARANEERPLAFILHDQRERSIARKLAEHLRGLGAPVWFDEYSVGAGASLRESIERGMRECGRAIVIVSPSFLENTRAVAGELGALRSRDAESGKGAPIPIWYGVDRAGVESYSTSLADRRAIPWDPHVDRLAAVVFQELTGLRAPRRSE